MALDRELGPEKLDDLDRLAKKVLARFPDHVSTLRDHAQALLNVARHDHPVFAEGLLDRVMELLKGSREGVLTALQAEQAASDPDNVARGRRHALPDMDFRKIKSIVSQIGGREDAVALARQLEADRAALGTGLLPK